MTIRMRPHHLLCLLTYVGKGYSGAFIANMNKLVHRLRPGKDVVVVSDPDDICAPLPEPHQIGKPHCTGKSVGERDRLAANDIGRFLGYRIAEDEKIILDFEFLHQMRQACIDCEWSELCSSITLSGYAKTLIQK